MQIAGIGYQTLEDFTEDKEHDHTPLFIISVFDMVRDIQVESFQGEKHHGRIIFNIFEDSTYKFCINANPDSYLFNKFEFMKIKIYVESYADLAELDVKVESLKFDDIKQIDKKLSNVHSKVIDIMRTQNYQILREEEYSNKQISNSIILMYLTGVQILLVIVLIFYQTASLKNIFKDLIK